jgi:hypothetical protein
MVRVWDKFKVCIGFWGLVTVKVKLSGYEKVYGNFQN